MKSWWLWQKSNSISQQVIGTRRVVESPYFEDQLGPKWRRFYHPDNSFTLKCISNGWDQTNISPLCLNYTVHQHRWSVIDTIFICQGRWAPNTAHSRLSSRKEEHHHFQTTLQQFAQRRRFQGRDRLWSWDGQGGEGEAKWISFSFLNIIQKWSVRVLHLLATDSFILCRFPILLR